MGRHGKFFAEFALVLSALVFVAIFTPVENAPPASVAVVRGVSLMLPQSGVASQPAGTVAMEDAGAGRLSLAASESGALSVVRGGELAFAQTMDGLAAAAGPLRELEIFAGVAGAVGVAAASRRRRR